ncbi:ATP-binding protein [Bisbaumannia pacifica]|uniref:PhoH-like protein n=1 Tax=Bisbaumannia pacifica TaxID=77098 RepID=A0A510XB78_9GAMM|nr:PhoH family protein [Halomonas pacifica]GEK48692.1 ATP-binding protein [Halomonas pacifica]
MSQHSSQANRIITLNLEPNDPRRLANLCGQRDEHLKLVESRLGVTLRNRGNTFQLAGPGARVKAAANVLEHLYREAEADELSPDTVHLFLQESGLEALEEDEGPLDDHEVLLRTPKVVIKPRGQNQQGYVQSIRNHDINFGIGPAGTGKTYLAVAAAVEALNQQQVRRILLVRPAVEAGEKLGFLPGDLAQKIDPYLRPLYDALYEMLGFEQVGKLIERQIIEIAPLAYMRGRTLNNSFIILDESQNTTREQMKMFLTRIGFGSTAVITGDVTQVDLPRGQSSGLIQVLDVLKDTAGIGVTHFAAKDVVRHPMVQRIIEAYDRFEAEQEAEERARKEARREARERQQAGQANGTPGDADQ